MSTSLVGDILAIALFIIATFGVLCGFPIAFSLAGFSLLFAALGWALGVFDPIFLTSLPSRYFGLMTNEVLVAVPLFIFMGAVLERSKIAEALLETMGQLFGTMRGGLAISVVIVGALLAASTGVVGATVVTMGLISLPAMMRAGYDPKLATGVICASGTLGQIIPPSVILIFVGDLLMGANQLAAQRTGKPLDPVSVGDLFAGAFLPGLSLVALYILYIIGLAFVRPEGLPGAGDGRRATRLARPTLRARADTAAAADRGGAGLDPGGFRHAHRGRLDRRRRLDDPGRLQPRLLLRARCSRSCATPR